MKNLFLIFTFICASVLSANAQNLLPNGDFEIWGKKSKLPASWSGSNRKNIFSKSAEAHSGSNALQIKFTPEKKNANVRIQSENAISLKAGKYECSFFVKGEGEVRYFSLTQKDAKSGSKASDTNILGSPKIKKINASGWQEYKLTFDIPADDQYILYVGFNSASDSNPILLDDFSLVKK